MTKSINKYLLSGVVLGALLLLGVATVKANPSFFVRDQFSTTDLTSAASGGGFLTAGTGTTTLVFDTGLNAAGSTDSSVLLIQYAGSSTSATLNADIQYSQDGVVYYADTANATTTTPQSLQAPQTLSLVFASSTINRSVVTNANSATTTRKVIVPTPTRYVRAVFYAPVGSTNGTFWAEFVAKKQNP